MEHKLVTNIRLPLPIDRVFEFYARAENLERITPPELQFEIITPSPITIEEGTLIDYKLKLFGFPLSWKTCISTWKPPFLFVDEQLEGPYRQWIHQHRFEEEGDSTIITDEVRYRLPLEPLSALVHPMVRQQLRRIFSHREWRVRELLVKQDRSTAREAKPIVEFY